MVRHNLREREEELIKAGEALDRLEKDYATDWQFSRRNANSDMQATQMTNELGYKFNEFRARQIVARLRLEHGYDAPNTEGE